MMTNIFSIFDPSSNLFFSLNWLSSLIILSLIPLQFWLIPSRYIMMWNMIIHSIFNEFKSLINYSYSNLIMFLSLFFFIMINNFLGLFPYIFTSSSHMSFCLSLSLSMWLGMMIYGWMNFFNTMLSHLVPLGTPMYLIPFMTIIETISLIIRPITLSIRLTANMIAGHLLLSLLGLSGPQISNWNLFFLFMFSQIILMILEMAVSLIQAYVFSILTSLYVSEI